MSYLMLPGMGAEETNIYGDPVGTMYAGGTPLFNEATGERITIEEYKRRKQATSAPTKPTTGFDWGKIIVPNIIDPDIINPAASQHIEDYRGWNINYDRYGSPGAPFVATKKGTSGFTWSSFGLQTSTEVNRVTASSLEAVKKRVDGAIAGTYIPPEVIHARKVAHNNQIAYASNKAFQEAIPVSSDQIHARRSGTPKGSYKGWVLREHAYSLKSELQGLGFSIATIKPVANSNLQSAPFHPIWVGVLDSDPTQTVTGNTEAEVKAKIDSRTSPAVPVNAPVAAETVSPGKKLAIGGGIAAAAVAAFLMMQG